MSSFPNSIDTFVDEEDGVSYPVASDMNGAYDAIEKIEAKVGIDGSAVASSLDYIVKNTTFGHDHDGVDSKKVIVTNLNPTGLTASQLLRVNSGGTAIESAGSTLTAVISAAWPIGSVYTNITGVNPGTELGFGTWSQIAGGKVLIGQTSGDADFNVAEETGGAKTATLAVANLPAHNHTGSTTANESSHTHTGPSHTHAYSGTSSGQSATHTHTNTFSENDASAGPNIRAGGGDTTSGSINNASADHTHTYSGTSVAGGTGATGAGSAHSHSVTVASQGSGTAFSVMNPYFTVYFYKRTA